jgi:hypothetical protein
MKKSHGNKNEPLFSLFNMGITEATDIETEPVKQSKKSRKKWLSTNQDLPKMEDPSQSLNYE